MSDIQDAIHQEIGRALARRPGMKIATITSYDPNRHAIKATIQPDGYETGWFPHSVPHIGNGFGIVAGPQIGDQITVGFLDGDIENPVNLGRVHSDKERPPVAQSGEVVIQAGQMLIKLDKNGNMTMSAPNGMSLTMQNLTITGNVAISGGTLTHNGHDVGSTHLHTGVTPGAANTGPPQ